MTERAQEVDTVPGVAQSPVRLRQARESAGLHVAALAAALKVPVRKLEALEAGRYEELPDMTFARALAASACRHLRVDPAAVLAEIPVGHRPALGDSDSTINAPFKPTGVPIPGSTLGWLSRPAVLGAIALLLGALVILLLPSMEPAPEQVVAAEAPVAPGAVAEAAPGVAPGLIVESASPALPAATAPEGSPAGQGVALADPPAAAGASAAAPGASAASTDVPAGAAVLSLQASAPAWVEVTSGTGAVLLQRMLQSGERVDLSSPPPYAVVLGKADAVAVTVRGQRLDTASMARNGVARFEVK